jgi:hypothetical protein
MSDKDLDKKIEKAVKAAMPEGSTIKTSSKNGVKTVSGSVFIAGVEEKLDVSYSAKGPVSIQSMDIAGGTRVERSAEFGDLSAVAASLKMPSGDLSAGTYSVGNWNNEKQTIPEEQVKETEKRLEQVADAIKKAATPPVKHSPRPKR